MAIASRRPLTRQEKKQRLVSGLKTVARRGVTFAGQSISFAERQAITRTILRKKLMQNSSQQKQGRSITIKNKIRAVYTNPFNEISLLIREKRLIPFFESIKCEDYKKIARNISRMGTSFDFFLALKKFNALPEFISECSKKKALQAFFSELNEEDVKKFVSTFGHEITKIVEGFAKAPDRGYAVESFIRGITNKPRKMFWFGRYVGEDVRVLARDLSNNRLLSRFLSSMEGNISEFGEGLGIKIGAFSKGITLSNYGDSEFVNGVINNYDKLVEGIDKTPVYQNTAMRIFLEQFHNISEPKDSFDNICTLVEKIKNRESKAVKELANDFPSYRERRRHY